MKQIVVISGKGGTGKTTITASFAVLAKNRVMADCDVDAADLHLLLHPEVKETHDYEGGKTAVIDQEKCIQCGKCVDVCRFSAISLRGPRSTVHGPQTENYGQSTMDYGLKIDTLACEGCGACQLVCPQDAISLEIEEAGYWFVSETNYGPMVHAKLGIAQENSGRLVSVVRQKAQDIAVEKNLDYIIIDGPPGIGCPVIASLSGVDLALVVTEPTLSGIYDLERVVKVTNHFGTKTLVCINKYDINLQNAQKIRDYCCQRNIPVVAEIPFDRAVPKSLVKAQPIVTFPDSKVSSAIKNMWAKIEKEIS